MFCNELPVSILNIFKVADSFLRIAKILVPIIIIVPTIIGFATASMSNNAEALKKTAKLFPTRLVIGIAVFLLPTIINLVFNMVDPNISNDGLSCLLSVDENMISNAKYNQILKAYDKAQKELTYANLHDLEAAIDQLDDTNAMKKTYESQYENLKRILDKTKNDNEKKREEAIAKSLDNNISGFPDKFINSVKNVYETAHNGGYKYGNSQALPPTSDKLISCDRLIAKALWDLDPYFQDQPTGGMTCGTEESYLTSHGFTKSTSKSDIKKGSIIAQGKYSTTHTYVVVSYDKNTDKVVKYDMGSDKRIQSTQPFTGETAHDFIAVYNYKG